MLARALGLLVVLALTTASGVLITRLLPDLVQEVGVAPSATTSPAPTSAPSPAPSGSAPGPALPLAGVRIALDPGHQLGNRNFPSQINARVPAGGFTKACNTTGTATNAGFPEATFTWELAQRIKRHLSRLGATVLLTREANSDSLWGPCVNERGAFGARVRAELSVSLHADGAAGSAHGFHVIVPGVVAGFTDDIAGPSKRLGEALRQGLDSAGVARSTYVTDGFNERTDLGTLNLSDVPIAMLELGNMRNPEDAEQMTTAAGQRTYARGIVAGIREYLGR